jgi:Flp pilus assembly protein protease CpaA
MAWIDVDALSASAVVTAAAALIDLRTMRIPNWLTLPSAAAGAALLAAECAAGYPWAAAAVTAAGSFAFVYLLWRARLWGGGDAKLVLAIFLLASPSFPPLSFMAAFLASLSVMIALRHAAEALARRSGDRPRPLGPLLLAALPVSLGLLHILGAQA